MTNTLDLQQIVEACLLAAEKPLALTDIQAVFDEHELPNKAALEVALEGVRQRYQDRPMELKQVASGYRLQVRTDFTPWVSKLFEEKPGRLSKAFLETLAIIAFRQPVTRGDIEEIRGVAVSSNIIRSLIEREWIRVIGRKEVPGRPAIYATTRHFLDYFSLESLNDLPPLEAPAEATASVDEITEILTKADNVIPLIRQNPKTNPEEQES